MKKIAILSTILLFSMLSTVAFAQKDKKKEKKIEIKLQQKNEAGELIKIDTSFVLEEGQNAQEVIDKIMAEKGIKSEKKKNVWISIDDDSNKKELKKIIVEIDEDGDTKKIDKYEKMIFIGDDDDKMQTFDIDIDIDDDDVMNFNVKSDDSDSLIKIIKIKGNKIWHSNNGNVHIIDNGNMHFFPEMEEHQDILKDAKPGDTLKIKTIASINGKENVSEKEIIISDSINNMHKTIFIQNSDNKQIKKKYIIKTDIDTDKKHKIKKMHKNEDVFFYNSEEESINISITDAEKDDLANIKLPKSYKQLDINDLQITHEENKVKLNFDIINKANTNIKLYDKNGKEIFTDELKKFSGKYTKEIDIDKGEFILEVNQGKNYFHKKITIVK